MRCREIVDEARKLLAQLMAQSKQHTHLHTGHRMRPRKSRTGDGLLDKAFADRPLEWSGCSGELNWSLTRWQLESAIYRAAGKAHFPELRLRQAAPQTHLMPARRSHVKWEAGAKFVEGVT